MQGEWYSVLIKKGCWKEDDHEQGECDLCKSYLSLELKFLIYCIVFLGKYNK